MPELLDRLQVALGVAAIGQIMMRGWYAGCRWSTPRGAAFGMVAQADLALHTEAVSESEIGGVVERISEPGSGDAGLRH
jgi:hypothetical protein